MDDNNQSLNKNKRKQINKATIIIIVLVILILLAGFYIFLSHSKNKNVCTKVEVSKSVAIDESGLHLEAGKVQYIFGEEYKDDFEFIQSLMAFDEIAYNICHEDYKETDSMFYIGSTMKSKKVTEYNIYDSTTNKKIKSRDVKSLIAELGYHSYGKHSEKLKVVSIDDSLVITHLTLELKNGKKIELSAIDIENEKLKKLKEGKKYRFDFEVKESSIFGGISYDLLDVDVD